VSSFCAPSRSFASVPFFVCDNKFEPGHLSTIGVDFGVRTIKVDNRVAKLQIWDTAGQERFRTITASYYRGGDAVMLVCDVTNPESLESIPSWYNEYRRYAKEDAQVILVANKCDEEGKRKVKPEEIQEMANKLSIPSYIETSAKTAKNVQEAFVKVAAQYLKIGQPHPRSAQSPSKKFGSTVALDTGESVQCPSCVIL